MNEDSLNLIRILEKSCRKTQDGHLQQKFAKICNLVNNHGGAARTNTKTALYYVLN